MFLLPAAVILLATALSFLPERIADEPPLDSTAEGGRMVDKAALEVPSPGDTATGEPAPRR